MSVFTKVRDTVENIGSIATAPFTFGQSQRLVSKSGQASGLGGFAQKYNDIAKVVDIAALIAGGAYLAGPAIVGSAPELGVGAAEGATTALAAEAPAASTSSALAQGLVGDAAWGVNPALDAGAALDPVGLAASDAAGVAATAPVEAAETPGLLSQAGGWVEKHPITSLIGANMIGGAVSGIANRQAQLEAIQKKKEAELELADQPRVRKQGNPSVGGGGVNLNLRPSGRLLKRPDGSTVFVPGTGLIQGSMNGVRG